MHWVSHCHVTHCCHCFFFFMIRCPPRSTRTDTLFPYTTLFRSPFRAMLHIVGNGAFREFDAVTDLLPAMSATRFGVGRRFSKRSEEHTSELQSLMRISYAVFCLKKKKHILTINNRNLQNHTHSARTCTNIHTTTTKNT